MSTYLVGRPSRGFTLIELIAVISILGILASILGPKFFSTQPFSERGYADELATALRTAQRVAVASECNISFTANASGYSAARRAARVQCACPDAGPWPSTVALPDSTTLNGSTPGGVNVVGALQVVFNGQGGLCGGASASITIGSKPFTITINGVSGLVQVL